MKSRALYKSDKKRAGGMPKIGEELYWVKDDTQGGVDIDHGYDTHGTVDKFREKSVHDGREKNPCAIWFF